MATQAALLSQLKDAGLEVHFGFLFLDQQHPRVPYVHLIAKINGKRFVWAQLCKHSQYLDDLTVRKALKCLKSAQLRHAV